MKKFRDDPSFVKSKFNSLLKDAAATIEEKEGRKVGVIKRKIVIRPNIRGTYVECKLVYYFNCISHYCYITMVIAHHYVPAGLAKPSVVKSVKPQGNKPLIAGKNSRLWGVFIILWWTSRSQEWPHVQGPITSYPYPVCKN